MIYGDFIETTFEHTSERRVFNHYDRNGFVCRLIKEEYARSWRKQNISLR